MQNICDRNNRNATGERTGFESKTPSQWTTWRGPANGCLVAEDVIDVLIFFWNPAEPLPHDQDIKALLRLAVASTIPVGSNRSIGDFSAVEPRR